MKNMSHEGLKYVCSYGQYFFATLAAICAIGNIYFGRLVETKKAAKVTLMGKIAPIHRAKGKTETFPSLEIGNSGTVFEIRDLPHLDDVFNTPGANFSVSKEDGQVKVSITIRDKTGKIVAELISNEWKSNPANWDRNYTQDAIEIKDSEGGVVLQAIALPDRVKMQMKLYTDKGEPRVFCENPDHQGGALLTTIETKVRIRPIFKYPSHSHLGERL
ncbi:hypothetical protein [Spirosoma flavum]|uniref:Uncharacterized protein n=1 Tax=Spirosoma flavum TaxID=2048557 RepID=A0ABW6ARF1_9BACT